MIKWVKSKGLNADIKQEGKMYVYNIEQALNKLRDIIGKELNHSKAKDVNLCLVKELREVEKIIKDNI